MSHAEILRRAKARIEDPEHWCRNADALDAEGIDVSPISDDAVKWCAGGAVFNSCCTNSSLIITRRFLLEAAQRLFKFYSITQTNDTLGHAAVMKMYDLAIDLAEEGEKK